MMTFDGWRTLPKLSIVTVCKKSKLCDWCERHIPYWPLPFKNKRQRVRCRQYFRWYHLRKLQKKMTTILNSSLAKKIDYDAVGKLFDDMPFEWEIVRKDA